MGCNIVTWDFFIHFEYPSIQVTVQYTPIMKKEGGRKGDGKILRSNGTSVVLIVTSMPYK